MNKQKKRAAGHSPWNRSNDTVETTEQYNDNTPLKKLQDIRDIAWQQAIKYRWDPVLSHTHNEYLAMLNEMIEECAI